LQLPVILILTITASIITTIYLSFLLLRVYLRKRLTPILFNLLVAISFLVVLISELLDYYINVYVTVMDLKLNVLDFLLTNFLVLGLFFWYLSIRLSETTNLGFDSIIFSIIAGMSIAGEIMEKSKFSVSFNSIVEVLGLFMFLYGAVTYILKSYKLAETESQRRRLLIYISGYIILLAGGIVSLSLDIDVWLFGYAVGYFIIVYMISKYPEFFIMSYIKPYRLLILLRDGTPIYLSDITPKASELKDITIMSSAISGISSLIGELLGSGKELKGIDHGDKKILVEPYKNIVGYLIADGESMIIRQGLRRIVREFHKRYSEILKEATLITENKFKEFSTFVKDIFAAF